MEWFISWVINKRGNRRFVEDGRVDMQTISEFASSIDWDPGIVLGWLLNDEKVDHED